MKTAAFATKYLPLTRFFSSLRASRLFTIISPILKIYKYEIGHLEDESKKSYRLYCIFPAEEPHRNKVLSGVDLPARDNYRYGGPD